MTIRELYSRNIKLQYMSNKIVRAVHLQNYDMALRGMRTLTKDLTELLHGLAEAESSFDVDIQGSGIHDFLKNILEAQSACDYILVADLIEIQLLPFLLSLQEGIRNSCDVMFCQETWDENIEKLRKKDAALAKLAEAEQEKWLADEMPAYWIEPTNSGLYTMASRDDKGNYYFHSNSNPQNEASEFALYYYDMLCDSYVVFGLGLGYHCEALAGLDEGIHIYIYENSLSVIVQAMMANVMDWLWDSDRIELIYDSELKLLAGKLSSVEMQEDRQVFIMHHPSLRHVANAAVRTKLEQLFIRDSGIRNTRALMESNFRENIKHYTDTVDGLRAGLAGKRVVIAAAGPSLDKNIRLLLDKPSDVIIIATGTVLRKLLALGIAVDYVIVADANRRVIRQIEGCLDCGVPMLYLSTAYQGFAKRYRGEKYIIFQQDYPSAMEEAKRLSAVAYGTGGSVSTTALDVCIRLGCKSIAFIGLDLAYTDNLAHAEGTSRRIANDIGDMPSVWGYELKAASNTPSGVSIEKCHVKSSRLFDMYRHWIEKRIAQPDVTMPIYDASEGGSVIAGMEIVSLERFLNT